MEPAPFLNKTALYDFVILERRSWGKLNLGLETENVHKPGRDSIGGGPRLSYPVGAIGNLKFVLALSYQVRPQERDVLRLYVVANQRFSAR